MRIYIPNTYRRWLVSIPVFGVLFFAGKAAVGRAGWERRFGVARTVAELEGLCGERPGEARCWARLAQSREQWGGSSREDWARAVEANPRDALVVTLAAHEAEGRGDLGGAERLLLLAERHNRLWLPRWTLANYYFRHGRTEDFWKWVRAALERSQGNLAPVFRMCEEAGGSAAFLLASVIPGEPRVLAGYVSYLAERGRGGDLGAAAGSFLDHQTAESREWAWRVVNVAVEGLLRSGRGEEARGLWNRMSRAGLVGYRVLDGERPLVNGDLGEPLSPAGFDWRVGRAEGLESYFGSPAGRAKFVLTGRQPEKVTLMAQTVWLEAGRRYRLTFEARWIGDVARARGVGWRVMGRAAGWSPGSEDWESGAVEVEAAAEGRAGEVELVAAREVGQVRPEGELRVRRVRLEGVK